MKISCGEEVAMENATSYIALAVVKFEVKKDTTKKITGRQDIVKESKKKPEPPTRALNDPRDN